MSKISHNGQFSIGHQRGGRPKGSLNASTIEIKAFCRDIVSGAEYRTKLAQDLIARRVSPALELMLWDRAFGPVPREVRVDSVEHSSTTDLLDRMRALLSAMPDADILPEEQLPEEIESKSNFHGPVDENEPPA